MAFAGAGSQAAGTTNSGRGTSATATGLGGAFLRDASAGSVTYGQPQAARFIDPVTRDYVVDDYGRLLGMNYVRHEVQMCVHTVRNTSAVAELGQRLRDIKRITPGIENEILIILTEAVQSLIARGLIEVVGFFGFRAGDDRNGLARGAIFGKFVWRDLTTGQEHQEFV